MLTSYLKPLCHIPKQVEVEIKDNQQEEEKDKHIKT